MKKSILRFIFITGYLFFLMMGSNAQQSDNRFDLLLKFGNVNLAENAAEFIKANPITENDLVNSYYYLIVQFYQIPSRDIKAQLQELGIVFVDYIPNKAYILAFPFSFDLKQLADFNIRHLSKIPPEYKQDQYILDKKYPQWALRENNQMDVIISFYRNLPFSFGLEKLNGLFVESIQEDAISNTLVARVNISNLEKIINQNYVQFIEPVYAPGEPENYTGKTLHRSNVLDSKYELGRHYDGTGVNIMLQDDGTIGPHADYEGRIGNQFITTNGGDHGDHCAGIIFGSGNIDPTTSGQAPGATLYTYGAAPLYPGFTSIPSHYGTYDIRISSTSYSNGCNAGYTSLARTMDLQINQYESLMHVFSAGNDGGSDCGYGAGAGWGNITGGHKIGKNVITVANLSETSSLAGSSSRGPAHDGRIKPDISAKGSDVYSTVDPNEYAYKSGTSMSCPGVSGSLGQLYQAYRELNSGDDPKGGFIKGLVLNTADDLGNEGPDFKYGWGQINNLKAVKLLEDERYETDEIDEGNTNIHTFNVPAGTKQLKVMVYWTDKEASIGTNKALLNDLDIQIEDPSSMVHLPWVLSHYPDPDSLNSPATKGMDHLNNMEQVSIDDPAAGSYTLTVDGFEVPWGPQEYYVFYELIMDEINLTYPIGGESFDPGEGVLVRWDAFGETSPFMVEYSLDDGVNWTTANASINANRRYYNWNVPAGITSKARIRVSRDGLSDTSPETFNIMGITDLITYERSCPESVLITWDPVDDAVSYDVYQLGEKYMEVIGNTTADSMLVEGINFENEYWFSVGAIGPDNAVGRRAIAKMKEPGIWNCVFSKDMAITDIISPPIGVLYECQDYSDVTVRVEINNSGLEDMQNVVAYYEFEGGGAISEAIPGTIMAGETIIHEFSSSISLPSTGVYDLTAWIETPDDQNSANDIIEGVCKLKSTQNLNINATETFDSYNNCGFAPDCEDVNCYINVQWFNLQNELNDEIDWRVMNGITPTTGTGPTGDHTSGTISGNFLYLEASGECYNKKAILNSPCIDLSGLSSPGLHFWYNLNGADMGSLHVDIISDGILNKDFIWPISGNFGPEWHEGNLYLDEYAGKTINVRFRGYTGNGELSDMAIDDIIVTEMTGISSNQAGKYMEVSPNPSSGIYQVRMKKSITENTSIKVMDVTGRIVYIDQMSDLNSNDGIYYLDISSLKNGLYYLIVETDTIKLNEKILKL
ncbi:MAG: S8 family serine peptidase [Bacteroidales bacterium]|nr:S8 family serine peptidase [Bacteroidales bacterium]MCF8404034.1 S8 family serine peptidase [Bacteroidales bacterium]